MTETILPSTDPSADTIVPPTPRDAQRDALRDLLSLSKDCSLYEAELEAKHAQSLEETTGKFERQNRDVEYRLDAQVRQVDEKVAEKEAAIAAAAKAELVKVESAVGQRRSRAEADYAKVKGSVKHQFAEKSWLADSVLEAAELSAAQDLRKDAERHEDQTGSMMIAESNVARIVTTYGQTPLPADQPSIELEAILPDADTILADKREAVARLMAKLKRLGFARLLVGAWPVVVVLVLCAIAAAIVQYRADSIEPQWDRLKMPVIATFVGGIILIVVGKLLIRSVIEKTYAPLRTAIADTRIASAAVHQNAQNARVEAVRSATGRRDAEVEEIRNQLQPQQAKAQQVRQAEVTAVEASQQSVLTQIEAARAKSTAELQQWKQRQLSEGARRVEDEKKNLRTQFDAKIEGLKSSYQERRKLLAARWHGGLSNIQAPIGPDEDSKAGRADWRAIAQRWQPADLFPPTVSFGSIEIDLKTLSEGIPADPSFKVALPDQFSVPALLAFPRQASLLLQTDPDGRDDGLRALQMLMTKILITLPPGRARFTIIDPVGLGQSFAGFMHLADHDDQLVTGRIWTTPEQIDERLTDLTEHMETVIQKYLRNEYATIDEYNAQAGELAEPYRFLVIADFPNGLEGEAWRRLLSISRAGPRCGVYTLILRDIRAALPPEMMIEDLQSASATLDRRGNRWVWDDDIFNQFPLTLDAPPDEATLTQLVHKVGKAAKEASRVEVDFDAIAPKPEDFWTRSAAVELAVPVGRMGATRLQYFNCGRGMAQHSLVAGKTGSGKSTLLHAMITNLAMWYSPDEVEFYLIDFKKGVEFKTYADYKLPHARAIAVESDREFGLSVLQRIDAELTRRGELFRKAGTQDLAAYRQTKDALIMPRVMLIIDEFQEFFTEDDRLSQDAQLLLDRLVRQGRAFGIHVFLGSQTIGGSGGLARTTISQMGIRIALQCSEADSQLILGDNNSAARLLSRPGEAIYNDAGGAVENNSPFQVAWLPDPKREKYLAAVNNKLKTEGVNRPVIPPIVFEGNRPADLAGNEPLLAALRSPAARSTSIKAWVGEPVAIKEPTSIIFRRQSGSHAIVVGQQDEQALSTLVAATLSLGAQLPPASASFVVFDGTPADSGLFGQLQSAVEALPNKIEFVDYRLVEPAVNEIAEEFARREADAEGNHPSIFLVINGLQRFRMLRKAEDEFSFSSSDEPKKDSAGKQFADLIREGPNVGIHIIAWCDTLASIERTLDRTLMREFDNRILFQMSSNDSSNLIDSPLANRLGFFRAILYSEEQGVMEKFRPYGLPDAKWLAELKETLATRAAVETA